jgi:hypothetical protein
MSNHAGRLQPKRSIYFGFERGDLAALILGLVIGLALLIAHPWYGDSHSSWPSVSGHVLETRIVVVHLLEHQYIPSEILYQFKRMSLTNATESNITRGSRFQSNPPIRDFLSSGCHKRKVKHALFAGHPRIQHM